MLTTVHCPLCVVILSRYEKHGLEGVASGVGDGAALGLWIWCKEWREGLILLLIRAYHAHRRLNLHPV